VLDLQTKDQACYCYQLLIVNRHSSHINLEFINYYNANRILVSVILLHLTHQLQLLDVGLFQLLLIAYSNELDNLTAWSSRIILIKKMF